MNPTLFSSATVEWETPQDFFDALDAEFHFTLDPCSTDENAKCAKHYTREDDGLSKDWTGETVYCNPPYGKEMPRWIAKCAEHGRRGGDRRYADPGPDGHQGVSRLHISPGGDPFRARALKVWRGQEQRPVPLHGLHISTEGRRGAWVTI